MTQCDIITIVWWVTKLCGIAVKEDDFRQLVEKAVHSQRRRHIVMCQTPASPGYTVSILRSHDAVMISYVTESDARSVRDIVTKCQSFVWLQATCSRPPPSPVE